MRRLMLVAVLCCPLLAVAEAVIELGTLSGQLSEELYQLPQELDALRERLAPRHARKGAADPAARACDLLGHGG